MKRCDGCEHSFESMAEPHGQRMDVLRCRCNPPQIVPFVFGSMFPIVEPGDYCGQFKEKP